MRLLWNASKEAVCFFTDVITRTRKLTTMKWNKYEKPTVEVIEIQEQTELLVGSVDVTGKREDYGENIEMQWGP